MQYKLPVYPTDVAPAKEWMMCNALIGAKSYEVLGCPVSFNEEIAPQWYNELNDENQLENIWAEQERYVKSLLNWMASKGITQIYFDGAYDDTESWFKEKHPKNGDNQIRWSDSLINDLPQVNIYNVFIESVDGTLLIAYESWDTLLVRDVSNNLPEELKQPTVGRD